jgi:hypothetical protein
MTKAQPASSMRGCTSCTNEIACGIFSVCLRVSPCACVCVCVCVCVYAAALYLELDSSTRLRNGDRCSKSYASSSTTQIWKNIYSLAHAWARKDSQTFVPSFFVDITVSVPSCRLTLAYSCCSVPTTITCPFSMPEFAERNAPAQSLCSPKRHTLPPTDTSTSSACASIPVTREIGKAQNLQHICDEIRKLASISQSAGFFSGSFFSLSSQDGGFRTQVSREISLQRKFSPLMTALDRLLPPKRTHKRTIENELHLLWIVCVARGKESREQTRFRLRWDEKAFLDERAYLLCWRKLLMSGGTVLISQCLACSD